MRGNSELLGGLAWLALGAAVTFAGWQLRLGVPTDPGSGFALFWIGLITCALSAAVIGRAIVQGGPSLASLWAGTRWPKIVLVVSMLLVFGAFFEQIGFIPSALALLLVLMRLVDRVTWPVALPVALGAVLGVWATLGLWLKIRLPAGILERFLG